MISYVIPYISTHIISTQPILYHIISYIMSYMCHIIYNAISYIPYTIYHIYNNIYHTNYHRQYHILYYTIHHIIYHIACHISLTSQITYCLVDKGCMNLPSTQELASQRLWSTLAKLPLFTKSTIFDMNKEKHASNHGPYECQIS